MEIDLYRDWVEFLKNQLDRFGYDIAKMQSSEAIVHTFLNLTKRMIRPTPRTILKAQNFSCPPYLCAGLAEVERKITLGENLLPHLSKQIHKPEFNDALLNDWGVHHLHLGAIIDSQGFVARTGPVLFARFDNVNAYLIDVLPHGSWTQQRLVQELHDNWPDSIQHRRIKNVDAIVTPISDEDIGTLRKKRFNTFIDLGGGVVYGPIGGGYMRSGIGFDVVYEADRCESRLREMQDSIVENIETIAEEAITKGVAFPEYPRFKLKIDNGILFAVEMNCMVAVPLPDL